MAVFAGFDPDGQLGGELVAPIDPLTPILVRYDLAGAHLDELVFAGAENSRIKAVQRGPADELVFAGSIHTHADFGAGPLTSVGYSDMFVHRRAP